MRVALAFVPLLLGCAPLLAQDGPPPPLANVQLDDPAKEARALSLMETLRCIQCQSQSIHDSDAPMAQAMRHEVRSRVAMGQSDAQITNWLVERYGNKVSFTPPASGAALLLWCLPILVLGFALWLARGRFGSGKS